jgi:hypothetical protein
MLEFIFMAGLGLLWLTLAEVKRQASRMALVTFILMLFLLATLIR